MIKVNVQLSMEYSLSWDDDNCSAGTSLYLIALQLNASQLLLSSACRLHFLTPSCTLAFWHTASIHLLRGLPTGLPPNILPSISFFGILELCIRCTCPAHSSLLSLMWVMTSGDLYILYSSSLWRSSNWRFVTTEFLQDKAVNLVPNP
jgi:hypothetical protein